MAHAPSDALILLYHRVADLEGDPWAMAVSPQHFTEQLEVLRRHYRLAPLRGLIEPARPGTGPGPTVAITFDDGYADNLHAADETLRRYDAPATVFLTTGFIGQARETWWDELDRLVLQPTELPPTLELDLGGEVRSWSLGGDALYSAATARLHRAWRAWEEPPTARHQLYVSLRELLRPLPDGEQRRVLGTLARWAGAGLEPRPTHRTLSVREVLALASQELVEIGAHTVTHPALGVLPRGTQRQEIVQSKRQLEEWLGTTVMAFAYPYGGSDDYTAETVGLVREAGLTTACMGCSGLVRGDTDAYRLPRLHVANWDGAEFATRLSDQLGA